MKLCKATKEATKKTEDFRERSKVLEDFDLTYTLYKEEKMKVKCHIFQTQVRFPSRKFGTAFLCSLQSRAVKCHLSAWKLTVSTLQQTECPAKTFVLMILSFLQQKYCWQLAPRLQANHALVLWRKAARSSRHLQLALWKQGICPVTHHDVLSYFIQWGKTPTKTTL